MARRSDRALDGDRLEADGPELLREGEVRVGPAGFARALLTRGEKRPVALPLRRARVAGGAARMAWIAEAVKKDALGWLAREGGWRERMVVVGGRRTEGRLWDPRIYPRLGVRFTPGPLRLLVAAMETRRPLPQLSVHEREVITAGIAGDDPASGDLLALHRITSQLRAGAAPGREARRLQAQDDPARAVCPHCGAPLELAPPAGDAAPGAAPATSAPPPTPAPTASRGSRPGRAGKAPPAAPPLRACPSCKGALRPEDLQSWGEGNRVLEQLRRELLELSPLGLLFHPEEAGRLAGTGPQATTALAARLAPVFRGDRAVLLSYLDRALARSWLEEERRRRRLTAPEAQESYAASTRGLQAYMLAARARPDALRPLMTFFERYVVHAFGGRAPVSEALRAQSLAYDRASEREAFLRTAAGLFALGREVTRVVEDALGTSYVERSEEQKVILSDHHERFRDVGPEVEAIRRELAGEIG